MSLGAPPVQKFFESQRLRISYWDWGNEDKPTFVFVHGGYDHARSWDRIVEAFRDDYHVVAIDLRGHGDSDAAIGSQYAIPDLAIDVVRLVEEVGAPAKIVGHSFGASTTLIAAGTFPELFDGVIAIEGTHSLNPPEFMDEGMGPNWLRMYADRVREYEDMTPTVYPTLEEVTHRLARQNPHQRHEWVEHLAQYGAKKVEGGYIWKWDLWVRGRTSMELRREELERFWANIDCPVLLLFASSGTGRAAQRLDAAPLFKDARSIVVDPATHTVQHDQPERTIAEMKSFLASL